VRTLSGTNWEEVDGLAVNATGVYTTGRFEGTTDFDPGTGTFPLTSKGSPDQFISKLDSDGNFVWAASVGGEGAYTWGFDVAVDPAGNVFSTGAFEGTVDFDPGPGVYSLKSAIPSPASQGSSHDAFVSRFDSSGQLVWARQMGGSWYEYGNGIALDGDGNVYTTGYFAGTADFDPGPARVRLTPLPSESPNAFVSKLDRFGDHIWARHLGRGGQTEAFAVAVSENGDVFSTGRFGDTADFDPGLGKEIRTTPGTSDVFLSRLTQPHGPSITPRLPATATMF
jgi:hypothetical protein